MIKKIIYNKLLHHKVEVCIAESDKEFDDTINKVKKITGTTFELTHKEVEGLYTGSEKNKGYSFIILNGIKIPEISHEIIHLIFDVFESRGIPARRENDEIFAYHSSFYMREILAMKAQPSAKNKKNLV